MSRFVPFLAEEAIERDAAALLAEFEQARCITVEPPIPIEDIVEKHLKLGIEFDDLDQRLGVPKLIDTGSGPDILGAIFFDEARIAIDQHLDPDEYPALEGRYRFTVAHEGGGHWRLHRHLFAKTSAQGALFDVADEPAIVCRSSQAKERVEWQADFYASCLLMPRKMIFAVWDEFFPDRNPRVLQPKSPIEHPSFEISRVDPSIGTIDIFETEGEILERFCRPLAERFLVSPIAMRIRLEKLGLLHRTVPLQGLLIGK